MGPRKHFTPEFKREAVEVLESGSRPASQIARELGIRRNQLYKWQAELRALGGGAFPGSGRPAGPKDEVTRLKQALAQVTEERDILKKAALSSTDQCNTIHTNLDMEGVDYGTIRAPRALGYRSPEEFEQQAGDP